MYLHVDLGDPDRHAKKTNWNGPVGCMVKGSIHLFWVTFLVRPQQKNRGLCDARVHVLCHFSLSATMDLYKSRSDFYETWQ